MQENFKPNTISENTQSLANYLPNGRVFHAKNIDDSNLRKLLAGLASEFTRVQSKIYELSEEYRLDTTTNLIDEWERALGIPDGCFTNTVPIEQRRKQIVAKFAKMNLLTEQDWINLAAYFGYNISIEHGTVSSLFPMQFPIYFAGGVKQARFTMIIKFVDLPSPSNVFPLKFDFQFMDENIMICLFEHLKPVDVNVIYQYKDS